MFNSKIQPKKSKALIQVVSTIALIICLNSLIDGLPDLFAKRGYVIIFNRASASVAPQEEPKQEEQAPFDAEKAICEAFGEKDCPTALAIAKAESGLSADKESDTDRMKDGRAFSLGLFQINLTVHRLKGVDCFKAFRGKDYDAQVVDEELYSRCVELAKDGKTNIETAKGIFDRSGQNFGKWGAFINDSYLRFMES